MTDLTTFTLAAPNAVWKHALATPLTVLRLALEQAHLHATSLDVSLPQLPQAIAQLEYVTSLLYRHDPQPWQLRSVLHGTIQRLDCSDSRRVKLIDNLLRDVTFTTTPLDFQEALSCAITNAWEAYPPQQPAVVVVSTYAKQNEVVLQIQDYGEGMTWLTLQRIIARGKSTKRHHQGIGTRFIRQVIEQELNGRIIYTSYVGIGTTQTWIIPLPASDTHSHELSPPDL